MAAASVHNVLLHADLPRSRRCCCYCIKAKLEKKRCVQPWNAGQAHYEKKLRGTVPQEQLASEEAITHAVAKDGNETRAQLLTAEEGLHERHDERQAELREIRAHQLLQEHIAILEKKEGDAG